MYIIIYYVRIYLHYIQPPLCTYYLTIGLYFNIHQIHDLRFIIYTYIYKQITAFTVQNRNIIYRKLTAKILTNNN